MPTSVNCPVVGTFQADASADIEVVYMETYVLPDANAEFTASVDMFSHFNLAEEASGNSVVGYTVSIANAAAFKTALGNLIKADATNNSQLAAAWMLEYLRTEINALLTTDGVGAALEASVVKNLAFKDWDVQAQLGADALGDALAADQDALNSIGLQLPASQYSQENTAEGNLSSVAASGDSLTFQFTVTSEVKTSYDPKEKAATYAPNGLSAADGKTGPTVQKSRILNFTAIKA